MDKIMEAKKQVKLRNWQMMYSEYQASGQTDRRWCEEKNLSTKTFYYRLRKLWEATIKQELYEIVPVRDSVEETKAPTYNTRVIRITGRGIAAELPMDISPELLTVAGKRAVIMLKETKFEPVYIVCDYTYMRRSIDGLARIVKQNFGLEPCSGSLFLFCGKRRDRMKALLWEGDGFLLMYKRLDNGCFQWPRNGAEARLLTHE